MCPGGHCVPRVRLVLQEAALSKGSEACPGSSWDVLGEACTEMEVTGGAEEPGGQQNLSYDL